MFIAENPSTINPRGVHQSPGSGNPPAAPLHHQPSTINHQPLTINHQPSTINHQPSTINHQPSTI
ncbi:MAG: hypothetical protein ACHBN1_11610 [Heteroscytonema crispum UTEX LB 1556]